MIDHVRELSDNASQWSIIAHVYVNLEGLSKKCVQVGFVKRFEDIAAFGRGFTQNQPLFDFVDAGNGKECVDHEIRGMKYLCVSIYARR